MDSRQSEIGRGQRRPVRLVFELCTRVGIAAALLAVSLAATAGTAGADVWVAREEVKKLLDRELSSIEGLPSDLADVPMRAIKSFLKAEADRIKELSGGEVDDYIDSVRESLRRAREDGSLTRAIRDELARLPGLAEDMVPRVVRAELAALADADVALTRALVNEAMKSVVLDRLDRLRDTRIRLAERGVPTTTTPLGDASYTSGEPGSVASRSFIPDITIVKSESSFTRMLFENEYRTSFGSMKLTAAKFEGLYKARVGKLSFKDEFGRTHEGLGATFTAKTTFSLLRADGRTDPVDLANEHLRMRASLLGTLASNLELRSSNMVTRDGFVSHTELRAGASARVELRVPIEVDLALVTVRFVPYASAHVGTTAEAHARVEIEWSGRLLVDVGASLAEGVGAGVGFVLEIEAGPVLKKLIAKVREYLVDHIRPIAERLAGRMEMGPARRGGAMRVSEAELAARLDSSIRFPGTGLSDAEIASRYAPVIYQRVHPRMPRGDFLCRVDFDGDFDGNNNWDNARRADADLSAHVYYDVKETETHYYVTYAFYHARRTSRALRIIRGMFEHTHDMGGIVVVVEKQAVPLREVLLVEAASGDRFHQYSNRSRAERPSRRYDGFDGKVRFIDEVSHPFFDHDRTHPQIWIDSKDHDVYGFNGRVDTAPGSFSGKEGVAYYPTGNAESPTSSRDPAVGYALLSLKRELYDRRNLRVGEGEGAELFSEASVQPRGASEELPLAFRGTRGIDDAARLPWAWYDWTEENEEREARENNDPFARDDDEWVREGDLFIDPARVVSLHFDMDDRPFATTYLRNSYVQPSLLTNPDGQPDHERSASIGIVDVLNANR